MELIGRVEEQKLLNDCMKSSESKLVTIYGRRRVGKTFLIRNYFGKSIKFEISGLHKGDFYDQLNHVFETLKEHGYDASKEDYPDTWMQAFDLIKKYINKLKGKGKKVIVFDEMPWFDTPRSKFLMAFENFWNSFCTKRTDLVVVICGSAASWIIKKIVKNKGGLHNRHSEKIALYPFTLRESEAFLKHKNIKFSRYDILQLHMITGGVPLYLDKVRRGEGLVQFIDRTCFQQNGFFLDEYNELLSSLFDKSERHALILKTLANKKSGFDRTTLASKVKMSSGGSFTELIDELVYSGFVSSYVPFGGSKNNLIYRLSDAYVSFYYHYLVSNNDVGKSWKTKSISPSWNAWAGIAFEQICFSHQEQILKALNLQAIECNVAPWSVKTSKDGAQIDLLIDRNDRIINLCEIKFSKGTFEINKAYAMNLRNKMQLLSQHKLARQKAIFLTMITTFGVKQNMYANELVDNDVLADYLFI